MSIFYNIKNTSGDQEWDQPLAVPPMDYEIAQGVSLTRNKGQEPQNHKCLIAANPARIDEGLYALDSQEVKSPPAWWGLNSIVNKVRRVCGREEKKTFSRVMSSVGYYAGAIRNAINPESVTQWDAWQEEEQKKYSYTKTPANIDDSSTWLKNQGITERHDKKFFSYDGEEITEEGEGEVAVIVSDDLQWVWVKNKVEPGCAVVEEPIEEENATDNEETKPPTLESLPTVQEKMKSVLVPTLAPTSQTSESNRQNSTDIEDEVGNKASHSFALSYRKHPLFSDKTKNHFKVYKADSNVANRLEQDEERFGKKVPIGWVLEKLKTGDVNEHLALALEPILKEKFKNQ